MTMRSSVVALAALALSGACGGDDGGSADCSEFSACGGDPIGEWSIVDACFEGELELGLDNCPEATAELNSFSVSGTASIRDDNSYSVSSTTMGDLSFTIPLSCLNGASCDDLAQAAEATCTQNGDACDCEDDVNETSQETGTWAASGTTVTLTPAGGTASDAEFCVDGDVLKLQPETDPGANQVTIVMTR